MRVLLTIDIGNSFIKWGLHNGTRWLIQDKVATDTVSLLKQQWDSLSEQPNSIIISHVASQSVIEQLSGLLSVWPVSPQWIKALPFQCGVHNGYADPYQLGCDRWAALIAARKLQKQSCLVINVGTTITVDALSASGKFIGGIILPGPNLMLCSLKTNTEKLCDDVGSYQNFPTNTISATYSGVIQSAVGSIERMRHLFFEHLGDEPFCIISGGGAHVLLPFINFPLKVVENLVLEGLVVIAATSEQI